MRAQQVQEEQAKGNRWHKVLWVIYIAGIVFIGTLAFVRMIALFRRIKWRNSLDDTFPTACGDWAIEHGCTRVTLEQAGCTRPRDIATSNSIVFNVNNVDRLMNSQIAQCIDSIKGAKLMHPGNLSTMDTHNELIHVTFNSAIFGFIDDMFMISNEYLASGATIPISRKLSLQSQLRMGSYDFDQNYDHTKKMIDCLNDTFMNASATPAPCSVTD